MGYYVDIQKSDVVLQAEDLNEILDRWKELNSPKYNHLKSGGSYSGGKQTSWHYSWMPENYDKEVESAKDVLDLLGFDSEYDYDGNLHVKYYDSKTGNESVFFEKIADLVPVGQSILWHGEDGAQFLWYFDGKDLKETSDITDELFVQLKVMMNTKKEVTNSVEDIQVTESQTTDPEQERINQIRTRFKNII